MRLAALVVLLTGAAAAAADTVPSAPPLDFSLHKLVGERAGPTVLVVGGIQGDEPGGFSAAALLATRYRFTRGNVWVVPNLNFESIVRRSRGLHGDMNRKFDHVDRNDPDFTAVRRIQHIITDPAVDFVFNLHDGSGFFRTRSVDALRGPARWGQSIIIDQERIDAPRYGELGALAREVAASVNRDLVNRDYRFHIKNTRTRDGDVEMAKTLTYFAINRGKPAVGVEATKAVVTAWRAYYHLRVLETYLARLGVGFERSFPLTPPGVERSLGEDLRVSFYSGRVVLDASRIRSRIGYLPLRREGPLEFTASDPLIAVTGGEDGRYRLSYGNHLLSELHVQPFDYDLAIDGVTVIVDGRARQVHFGSIVDVREEFVVPPRAQHRVNVIGWRRRGVRDESGERIRRRDIEARFSIDRDARIFRVETYHGARFAGMFAVRFPAAGDRRPVVVPTLVKAAAGTESGSAGR